MTVFVRKSWNLMLDAIGDFPALDDLFVLRLIDDCLGYRVSVAFVFMKLSCFVNEQELHNLKLSVGKLLGDQK